MTSNILEQVKTAAAKRILFLPPKFDYLAIITAYLPSADKWDAAWQTRKET